MYVINYFGLCSFELSKNTILTRKNGKSVFFALLVTGTYTIIVIVIHFKSEKNVENVNMCRSLCKIIYAFIFGARRELNKKNTVYCDGFLNGAKIDTQTDRLICLMFLKHFRLRCPDNTYYYYIISQWIHPRSLSCSISFSLAVSTERRPLMGWWVIIPMVFRFCHLISVISHYFSCLMENITRLISLHLINGDTDAFKLHKYFYLGYFFPPICVCFLNI